MRASAPSLATNEKPYYEHPSSSSSSADPLLAAVGKGIDQGLENDLLTNRWTSSSGAVTGSGWDSFPISDLLVLPNSFGTLYLGETFRTYLCVRNESSLVVREPSLRVEMQVGSSDPQASSSADGVRWHQLAHLILPTPSGEDDQGKPVWELPPSQPLETALGYDIKDLGPHVLVCTVGYKSPIPAPPGMEGETIWQERSFRKFFKFSVDRSPISVRTKIHHPRHAISLHHPDLAIRKRVELEVQVQNVTDNGSSLVFDGLRLKAVPGWEWSSVDRPEKGGGEEMWKTKGGANELLTDGDIRQYLFTLWPSEEEKGTEIEGGIVLDNSADGHAMRGDKLGHLDISWRMSGGEPGRLQTSQLVRRRVWHPPVSAPSSSTTVLAPQLVSELTLLPDAIEVLRELKADSTVELGVKIAITDVSGTNLDRKEREVGKEEEAEDEGDDDDTPLSEIASSPKRKKAAAVHDDEEGEFIIIQRTFKLALQHCSISPPPPPSTSLSAAPALDDPSTPRKSPLPSRTSTPTHPSGLGLNKSRLQANLSNLVRNSSLSSLRPSRGSVDVVRGSEDGSGGGGTPTISRMSTPLPPAVPPKTGLAPSPGVTEKEAEEKEKFELPEPTISWARIAELYSAYAENHAQALTRQNLGTVPAHFLPTPHMVRFEGSSLITLPEVSVEVKASRGKNGKLYKVEDAGKVEGAVEAKLKFALEATGGDEEVVRFGALKVLLLGFKDVVEGQEEGEERRCMIVLKEIPVFAEALLQPY